MRWTFYGFALATATALVGCGPTPAPRPITPTPAPVVTPAPAPNVTPAPAAGTNADNTGVNVRDRDPAAKTPENQENNDEAVRITTEIRQKITSAEGMSVNARNVKIITENKTVTLRGPVATAEEKSRIEKFAKESAASYTVVNELEVP